MTQPQPLQPPDPSDNGPEHTTPLWYGQTQEQPQPLQPPDPSENGPEHTTPLWFGQTQAQPQYPPYTPESTQTPAEPHPTASLQPGVEPAQPARPRRWVELVAVAVLAAVLASASTYALARGDVGAIAPALGRTGVSEPPVVQANAAAPNWAVTAGVVSPSVVAISVVSGQSGGQGSGVIFDTKGDIVTNNHVVTGGGQDAKLTVTLNDKRTFDATVVGTDPSSDLAVIRLTNAPTDLKAIALGDANALRVGDPVMAVGNPLGLAGTVTTGIVSALNRPVTTSAQTSRDQFGQQTAGEPVVTNAVQTSAAINPGNSGGALVNGAGQLVGINSAIAQLGGSGVSSSQSGNIGIGFAIPVNEAQTVANQLITSGKATHAFLGVSSKDDVVPQGPAKRAAAVITAVTPGTPADKAGLKVGDAIIAVDGDPVDGALSLVAQVREHTAGDKVTLKILQGGQTKDIPVTLVARPATNP